MFALVFGWQWCGASEVTRRVLFVGIVVCSQHGKEGDSCFPGTAGYLRAAGRGTVAPTLACLPVPPHTLPLVTSALPSRSRCPAFLLPRPALPRQAHCEVPGSIPFIPFFLFLHYVSLRTHLTLSSLTYTSPHTPTTHHPPFHSPLALLVSALNAPCLPPTHMHALPHTVTIMYHSSAAALSCIC